MEKDMKTTEWAAAIQWPQERRIWSRLSREFKLALLSGGIIGFITHLYAFTNLLIGIDSVNSAFTENEHLASGRWALSFFSSFSSIEQMPVVICLISVAGLALAAALTVRVLELAHPVSIVLTAALVVTFPSVACTFAYLFTADAYFIALALNVLAVYLAKRYSKGWIAAVGLLALGCGIYQAYLCYAIGLFLFDCIMAALSGEAFKKLFLRGGKYILTLAAGLGVYVLIQNALLKAKGVELTDYQGMDSIGSLDVMDRLRAIPKAYAFFFNDFKKWPYIADWFQVFQWGLFLMGGVALAYLIVRKKLYREPLRLLVLASGVALLPLVLNFVMVMAYTARIHRLMVYSFVLVPVFAVKLGELAVQQMAVSHPKHWTAALRIGALFCAMVVWNNFCLCNIGYHSLQLCYENTFALSNRIAARVEVLEGYSDGVPLAIVGTPSDTELYGNRSRYMDYTAAINNCCFNVLTNRTFLRHYTGMQFPSISSGQRTALENSEKVAAMPNYPAKGSIAMVDGVIVVKFEEGVIK